MALAPSVKSEATRSIRTVTLLAAAALLALPSLAKAQFGGTTEETFSPIATVGISGLAAYDISWIPPEGGTYYLADRTNKSLDIIDTNSLAFTKNTNGLFVGVVLNANGTANNDLSGPNGVLTFLNPTAGVGEAWVGDGPQLQAGCPVFLGGKCSAVKVIDHAGDLTHTIVTNGVARADELCQDPVHHLIVIANDAEADFSFGTPFISFISTDTYQIVAQFLIPEATNGIEQCQWDRTTGLIFLNLPEVNGPGNDTADGQVYVFNPASPGSAPIAKYIIPNIDCAGPQGMAIGPEPQLLLGCNAKSADGLRKSVIIDKHTGALLAEGWTIGGADEVWFNPGDSHYSVTGESNTPPKFSIVDGTGAGAVDQAITLPVITAPSIGGAAVSQHSVAADPVNFRIFLPGAGGVTVLAPSAPQDGDDRASPNLSQ
jgi:hypothetical protein